MSLKIHKFLPNGRPNGKRIFSKFRLTHNTRAEDIIMTMKEALEECNVYAKLQSTLHWNVECVGWLHCHIDGADCVALQHLFQEILQAKMKKEIMLSCAVKTHS